MVTSASGANTMSKPIPSSSAPLPPAAARVSRVSSAAPADMKAGKRVASPVTRATAPPSWSTPISSGRRTLSVSSRLTRRICSGEVTFSVKAMTPPRCRRRTSPTGASVPLYLATITWPASSGSDIASTRRAARRVSASVGSRPGSSTAARGAAFGRSTGRGATEGAGVGVGSSAAATARASASGLVGVTWPQPVNASAHSAAAETSRVGVMAP